MCTDIIDDKIFELQKAANRHIDPLAIWTVYAITRYIYTGRSTAQFEKAFCEYPTEKMSDLIAYCMNHDRSDIGIIKSIKHLIFKKA